MKHIFIPKTWSETDKRLYLKIAKRKKNEHVAAYTTIAIGCQMFYGLAKHFHKQQEQHPFGEDEEGEADR